MQKKFISSYIRKLYFTQSKEEYMDFLNLFRYPKKESVTSFRHQLETVKGNGKPFALRVRATNSNLSKHVYVFQTNDEGILVLVRITTAIDSFRMGKGEDVNPDLVSRDEMEKVLLYAQEAWSKITSV